MRLSRITRYPWRVFLKTIQKSRGRSLTAKVTERSEKACIVVSDPFLPIRIKMEKNANFVLRGELYIGGRRDESASGMTERSRIMVRKHVHIGVDLICAWGVFITDCDWHEIIGHTNTQETVIGDHVWIAPNCSILKGSHIGNDCIIATGSVTHRTSFPDGTLIGGVPARVLATGRQWTRDML